MFPHPAVMDTRPAIQPLSVWDKLGLPNHNHEVIRAPKPPAAAAIWVAITTAEAYTESSPPQANWDPPLNPNQPNHRINTPKVPRSKLLPGIGFTDPSLPNFPILGPTMIAAASAATPPTACTIEEPAKSIKPISANQAPSPYHCHPPEIG